MKLSEDAKESLISVADSHSQIEENIPATRRNLIGSNNNTENRITENVIL